MKAIVTGSGGFIGGHLYSMLSGDCDWHPLRSIHDPDARSADVIFSVASGAEVSESLDNPRRFIRNNTDLILDLLEFAREMPNLKHFIHLSTSEVYGPCDEDEESKKEWSPTVTHSPYAASKAAQEAICMAYWKSFGVPVTIVNTMNVFGERQQPHKFIPMAVYKIMSGHQIVIHGEPGHETYRSYIHADCLSDALIFLAKNSYRPGSTRPPRFNVAGKEELPLSALLTRIWRILDKPCSFRMEAPSRPGHGGRYALDTRLIRDMGWRQPMDLQESLERTVGFLSRAASLD